MTSDPVLSGLIATMEGATLVASIHLPLEPVPASRPRVTTYGTYYQKTYTAWMAKAKKLLGAGNLTFHAKTPLFVVVESVSTKARTSKLTYPRYDVDNSAKAVLDIVTKVTGWWHDDDQIILLTSSKRFAAKGEAAHSNVHIYRCD
ncbi:RusA family crossover junction endodeoxyribonuclease [Luteibacter sp. 22Crub2.1]|uniref:RusA family crossover junction endodeoxyribonuclease n=1 Tax=Luteibacter sp. 22Crub2.1 TaxID=1283288 RepID=UPI0011161DC8|nr:RusA family crossover junction endodeoxyribonuclease [Luteibacter sp. 22Crub2.1]